MEGLRRRHVSPQRRERDDQGGEDGGIRARPRRGQEIPVFNDDHNFSFFFMFIIDYFMPIKLLMGLIFAFSTNFVPDEFWQSTEVAYKIFFREDGHLTWEWFVGLRSYVIPALIAGLYKIMQYFGGPIDAGSPRLIYGPQIVQAWLTILGLKAFHTFAEKRLGLQIADLAHRLFMMNWFTTYCFARTITNQTEMALNMICLYFLEFNNYVYFTVLLVINCYIRPTAAIFWVFFLPEFLRKFTIKQVLISIVLALLTIGYLTTLDIFYYHKFILTPWEFFKFNFLESGNEEFGTHSLFWYFFNGIPSILGPLMLILPFGLIIEGDTKRYFFIVMFYVTVLSTIGHKEIRFLLPILPLVFLVIASALYYLADWCNQNNVFGSYRQRRTMAKCMYHFIMFLNVAAAVYLGFVHQRGYRAIASVLQRELPDITAYRPEIWILTPCYSLPVFSFINWQRANYVFYVCPPHKFKHLYDYESPNSTLIYQPEDFNITEIVRDIELKQRYRGSPDYIVTYNDFAQVVLKTLNKGDSRSMYKPRSTAYHTYFADDGNKLVLLQKIDRGRMIREFREERMQKKLLKLNSSN